MGNQKQGASYRPVPPPVDDDDEDLDDLAPPVPPDGGWGWMVVVGSLFCNIIVDGVCFSFGIFYPTFIQHFNESRGKTAIVGSLIPGMYLGMGPIVSALANKYGCRRVTMAGSLLATVSFFASTFSPNVDVLIFTYGIMGGIGFGLMYLPAIVIVGFYFDKRRAFATGLAVCGSGIGTFLFAPFARYLLDQFGWQGGYWIISGIILNGCVCGALFRPLEAVSLRRLKPSKLRQLRDTPRGLIIERIIEEKKRNRTISTGSLDGCVITRDNTLIRDPEKINNVRNVTIRQLTTVEEEEDAVHAGEHTGRFRPPAPLPAEAGIPQQPAADVDAADPVAKTHELSFQNSNLTTPLIDLCASDKDVTKSLTLLTTLDAPVTRGRAFSESRRTNAAYRVSRTGVKVVLSTEPTKSKLSLSSLDLKSDLRAKMSRPMNRKDIFYSGSVHNLREFKQNPDMASYIASHTSIPSPADSQVPLGTFDSMVNVLKTMLDFTLLKSPTFLLLCTTNFLAMTGFFTPFVCVTDYAQRIGIPDLQATLLLSVLGVANTLGRVLCGFVSDRTWADCLVIHNMALVIAGLTTCAVPFITSYTLLVIYCAIFGSCIAAFITLRSILLVELLGLNKLTSSFGLLLAFQGSASLIGSPIAGAIFDSTQSYTMSFVVAGGLIAFAGMVALPVRRLALWEEWRWGACGETERTHTQVVDERDASD